MDDTFETKRAPGPGETAADAGEIQRRLDIAAESDANEGNRQELEDLAAGRVRPAREVLEEFRQDHGIPYL